MKQLKQRWEQIQGIYIHIPFCLQKCLYCDFASFAGKTDLMHAYALTLCKEIERRAGEMSILPEATIYFGGGTPSLMPIEDMKMIVDTLKKEKVWQQPAEVTMEMNPGTVGLDKLCRYRDLGIDRVSFGVQTLNDKELADVGRLHTAAQALEAIELAARAGFKRISADLIYGLPGQTVESFEHTLETLTRTSISHMSVYGLTLEEGTPLAALVNSGSLTLPSEEEAEAMYDLTISYLADKGFNRYEIANFAQAGQESLHNLVYWQYLPYHGFGSAACSFNGKMRLTNAAKIEDYLSDTPPTEEELPARTRLAEFLFLGLRTVAGITVATAQARFGVDVMAMFGEKINKFVAKGMMKFNQADGRLQLTDLGMKFGNEIFEIFL